MKTINNRTAKRITSDLLSVDNYIELVEIKGVGMFVKSYSDDYENGLYKVSDKFNYSDYLFNNYDSKSVHLFHAIYFNERG